MKVSRIMNAGGGPFLVSAMIRNHTVYHLGLLESKNKKYVIISYSPSFGSTSLYIRGSQ